MKPRPQQTTLTISGSIALDATRPVVVAWSIKPAAGDTPETIAKAIDAVCLELKTALLGAMP